MSRKIDKQTLEKFFKKECSVEEARDVILWLKKKENKDEVEAILGFQWANATGNGRINSDPDKIYTKVLSEIAEDKPRSKIRRMQSPMLYRRIAAAAIFLIMAAAIVLYFNLSGAGETADEMIVKTTNHGEKLTTKLPDGTLVSLNAGSKLTFPETFNGDERKVNLTGEAYFNVAHNVQQPFIVQSGPVETKALGTAFNIKTDAESDLIVVSLTEGKVVVHSSLDVGENQKDYFLMPGDEIQYSARGEFLAKRTFDYKTTVAWKDGFLVFKDVGIEELRRKMEKWYDVTIIYKNQPTKKWRFTSEYKNETLENVLEGLRFAKNINYVIENDTVEITF